MSDITFTVLNARPHLVRESDDVGFPCRVCGMYRMAASDLCLGCADMLHDARLVGSSEE